MKGDYDKYKCTVSHECWRKFSEEYPNELDYWTLRRIISTMGDLIIEEVINNPSGFRLPGDYGHLIMGGTPIKSIKARRSNSTLNLSRTENYVYSLIWLHGVQNNRGFYRFKTAKLVRNYITKCIREDKFLNWIKVNQYKDLLKLIV